MKKVFNTIAFVLITSAAALAQDSAKKLEKAPSTAVKDSVAANKPQKAMMEKKNDPQSAKKRNTDPPRKAMHEAPRKEN